MAVATVRCGKCGSDVSPRLWHVHVSNFTYHRTQHICPICGVVMYETGGGLQGWVRIVFMCALGMGFYEAGIGELHRYLWRDKLIGIGSLIGSVVFFTFAFVPLKTIMYGLGRVVGYLMGRR